MKADEVRLYALRGGLKKQSVCYTHFHSNEVFRGDLILFCFFTPTRKIQYNNGSVLLDRAVFLSLDLITNSNFSRCKQMLD